MRPRLHASACRKTTGALKIIHDKYAKNVALLETYKVCYCVCLCGVLRGKGNAHRRDTEGKKGWGVA